MNLPSKRTLWKFGRDAIIAAVGAVLLYSADHLADLGVPADWTPLIVPVLMLIYRFVRDDATTP